MSRFVKITRRHFGKWSGQLLMFLGLVLSYGTLGFLAGKFLYPRDRELKWVFLFPENELKRGDAFPFKLPSGVPITIARQDEKQVVEDFIALSTTCPHLGCRVHWEGHNDRFFCPCHNGVFDPKGNAVSGPPADANQDLKEYPLKLENGLLFVGISRETLGKKFV